MKFRVLSFPYQCMSDPRIDQLLRLSGVGPDAPEGSVRDLLSKAGYSEDEIDAYLASSAPVAVPQVAATPVREAAQPEVPPAVEPQVAARKVRMLRPIVIGIALAVFTLIVLPATASFWAGLAYGLSFFFGIGLLFVPFALIGNVLLGVYLNVYVTIHNGMYASSVEEQLTCGSLTVERSFENAVGTAKQYSWTGTPILINTDRSEVAIVTKEGKRGTFTPYEGDGTNAIVRPTPYQLSLTLGELATSMTIPASSNVSLGTVVASYNGDENAESLIREAGYTGLSYGSPGPIVELSESFLTHEEYDELRACEGFSELASRAIERTRDNNNTPDKQYFMPLPDTPLIMFLYRDSSEEGLSVNLQMDLSCTDGTKFKVEGPNIRQTYIPGPEWLTPKDTNMIVAKIEGRTVRPLTAAESAKVNEMPVDYMEMTARSYNELKTELAALKRCAQEAGICDTPVEVNLTDANGKRGRYAYYEAEQPREFNQYLSFYIGILEGQGGAYDKDPKRTTSALYMRDPSLPLPYSLGGCTDSTGKTLNEILAAN